MNATRSLHSLWSFRILKNLSFHWNHTQFMIQYPTIYFSCHRLINQSPLPYTELNPLITAAMLWLDALCFVVQFKTCKVNTLHLSIHETTGKLMPRLRYNKNYNGHQQTNLSLLTLQLGLLKASQEKYQLS